MTMKLLPIFILITGFLSFTSLAWAAYLYWGKNDHRMNALLGRRMGMATERLNIKSANPEDQLFRQIRFSQKPQVHEFLKKYRLSLILNDLLLEGGSKSLVDEFLIALGITFVASFVVISFVVSSWVSALFAACICTMVPLSLLKFQSYKRRTTVEKQLPHILEYISRSMLAGHSFNSSLQTAAENSEDPIASEFKLTFDQLNFGVPIKDAMGDLVKRIDTEDIRYFAIAVVINREIGGNLSELLNDVSKLIRQRLNTKLVIRTLTSQGKISALFLGSLPILSFLILKLILPHYFDAVFATDFGVKLFVGTALWAGFGFLWMKHLSNIKI